LPQRGLPHMSTKP